MINGVALSARELRGDRGMRGKIAGCRISVGQSARNDYFNNTGRARSTRHRFATIFIVDVPRVTFARLRFGNSRRFAARIIHNYRAGRSKYESPIGSELPLRRKFLRNRGPGGPGTHEPHVCSEKRGFIKAQEPSLRVRLVSDGARYREQIRKRFFSIQAASK